MATMYYEDKKNSLTNDISLLSDRKIKTPKELSLTEAKRFALDISKKLLETDENNNLLYTSSSPEIVEMLGRLEVMVTTYTNNYRDFVYEKCLKDRNPLLALAKVALIEKATFSSKKDKDNNTVVTVNVRQEHVNLADFVAYAKKHDRKLFTDDNWDNHVTALYNSIVTYRLQTIYLNAHEAEDRPTETAVIDKLSTLISGSAWRCVHELNQPKSKSWMRKELREALSLIEKDSPVTGRDIAWLIDCVCLGAGRDVYSLRFCKKATFEQRMFEVIIAHQHGLDLQLSK